MSDELLSLGEFISSVDFATSSAATRQTIDEAARSSLLCALVGIEQEQWIWNFPILFARGGSKATGAVKLLAGLFDVFEGVGHLGTAAGAADFDPMDPGPSHSALPATLASCVICAQGQVPQSRHATDVEVGSAVLAGIEAAMRVRRAISGTRPGVGYHSPGVYGAIAAAASAARTLRLSAAECANAIAIAIDRFSGLGINSAATLVGVTHFGWGTIHGLEAALLASQGWSASHDVGRAFATQFAASQIDLSVLAKPDPVSVTDALVFKWYPCNIYTNLVVLTLERVNREPIDRIEIRMPWIPHLDCPQPDGVRQARNSAQAVAAVAGAGDTSYAAFSGEAGIWKPSADVQRLIRHVDVVMDRSAPTDLQQASVAVRVWRGSAMVHEASRSMKDLRGWGRDHAAKLVGNKNKGGVEAIYDHSIVHGFQYVQGRRRSITAGKEPSF